VALAYLVPVYLVSAGLIGRAGLLPLLSIPLAIPLCRSVLRDHGAVLNKTLAGTARLVLVHGLLFSLGMVL